MSEFTKTDPPVSVLDRAFRFEHSAGVRRVMCVLATSALVVAATACSNDEADTEHCGGVGASFATTTLVTTAASTTSQPATTSMVTSAISVASSTSIVSITGAARLVALRSEAPAGYSFGTPKKVVTGLVIDSWRSDPLVSAAVGDISAKSVIKNSSGLSIALLFTVEVDQVTAGDPAKMARLQKALISPNDETATLSIAGNRWVKSPGIGSSPMYASNLDEGSKGGVVFVAYGGDAAAIEKFLAA